MASQTEKNMKCARIGTRNVLLRSVQVVLKGEIPRVSRMVFEVNYTLDSGDFGVVYKQRQLIVQRCEIKKIKSARSDVKIRQNPPFSIGQIRQKSARNLELFVPFFTPWGSVLWFFIADLA
jgi:hypothetical protein